MPKGLQGFQKGHPSFLTEESIKKMSTTRKILKSYWLIGKKWSKERKDARAKLTKYRWDSGSFIGTKGMKGENSYSWKGDKAKYGAIHMWISSQKGKPRFCEFCKKTDKKKYEWANIDHLYKRKIEDYLRLCTSCHRKHDYQNNIVKK